MGVIFASTWAAVVFGLLAIGLLLGGLFALLNSDEPSPAGGVIMLILMALCIWGFLYSTTHYVTPPNTISIVVSRTDGSTAHLYHPGVSQKRWIEMKFIYPGRTDYQWCPEMYPSVKGGAEIKTIICFSMDASQIEWDKQYRKYDGGEETVLLGWQREIESSVKQAISLYPPQDLTNSRLLVEQSITEYVLPWFTEQNIPLSSIHLNNWEFTSAEMKSAYESAQVSVAKIDAAKNELAAAEVQAQTASLRLQSCENAGFTTELYCFEFLRLQWLQGISPLPDNFILAIGNVVPAVTTSTVPSTTVPAEGGH